jgi:hypothetical protein
MEAVTFAKNSFDSLVASVREKIRLYRAIHPTSQDLRIGERLEYAIARPSHAWGVDSFIHSTQETRGIYCVRCDGHDFYFPNIVSHKDAMTLVIARTRQFVQEDGKTRTFSVAPDTINAPIGGGILYPCILYRID